MPQQDRTPWARAAEIAGGQHRIVSVVQLRGCGFSDTMISAAVRRGQLSRVSRGVYAFGAPPLLPYERAMAAVLGDQPRGC